MSSQFNRKWGMVDWFAVILRFFWFVSMLVSILVSDIPGGNGWVIVWITFTYLIPQFFYLPSNLKPTMYTISELVLNGTFNVYIVIHFPEALNNFIIPLFIMSLLSTSLKSLRIVLPTCFIAIPACIAIWGLFPLDSMLSLLSNYAIFFSFGFGFRMFLEQRRQLIEKNRLLEHFSSQIEKMAIVEERNRMSRELHDTVGHSLIASIIAMEAVEALIDPHPSQAKLRLHDLTGYLRKQLNDFRRTIHQLALTELQQALAETVRHTITSFSEHTGTRIHYEVQGEEEATKESVKLAVLRCLQEALTNAVKHGNAQQIAVKLCYLEDSIKLIVEDNGKGCEQLKPGFGIESMKARIESLGGEIAIVSIAGEGTTLSCNIPVRGLGAHESNKN